MVEFCEFCGDAHESPPRSSGIISPIFISGVFEAYNLHPAIAIDITIGNGYYGRVSEHATQYSYQRKKIVLEANVSVQTEFWGT